MPRIPDNYLKTCVYLYRSEDEAKTGGPGATGFLIGVPSSRHEGWSHIFVVTANHVISAGFRVPALNTIDGKRDWLPVDTNAWWPNEEGVDIAVLPLTGYYEKTHQVAMPTSSMILTEEDMEDLQIGPGDDVFMVGRFPDHEGVDMIRPAARFGCISVLPGDPVKFDGIPPQTVFLAEMRSVSGYSGSPVFVDFAETGRVKVLQQIPQRWRTRLLGVDIGHLKNKVKIVDDAGKLGDDAYAMVLSHMACVVPAWEISKMINAPRFQAFKDADDDLTAKIKSESKGELDFVDPGETQITGKGLEIPIPSEKQFKDVLKKASRKKP